MSDAPSDWQLFDVCVNLADKSFVKDRDELLSRAYQAGVRHILIPGSDLDNSRQNLELARHYNDNPNTPSLYTSVGYHPHQAKLWDDKSRESLAELAYKNQGTCLVRAIGECGLDYKRNFSTPEQQRQAFIEQLELAISLELPVFMHERDAHDDFFCILSEHHKELIQGGDKGEGNILVHCFTGEREHLEKYIELGCYIGITGWFCDERRGRHLSELVQLIPYDKLLIETDAPYLIPRNLDIPEAKQNRRNEPSYLPHILEALAKCLGQSPKQLASITLANSMAFLAIDDQHSRATA